MNATHRPRRRPVVLPLLACLVFGVVVPDLSPAPASRVTSEPVDGRRFLANLADAERQHDYRSLLAECDRQIAARPEDYEMYRRRALTRWGARKYDDALADFNHAAELARAKKAPARVQTVLYYGRALIRREQRDTAAEAAELERTTRFDPGFTDAFNDLAWIRATNPNAALRNGRQAVGLARHACEALPDSVKYLDTLAAAYAEAGDAKRAAEAENAAIKAARTDARTAGQHKDFLADAPARADLYAKGGQYREDPNRAAASSGPATISTAPRS